MITLSSGWASVIVILVIQALILAFTFGTLFQRVKALEGRKDGSDCTAALAAMEATLKGLQQALEHRISSLEATVQSLIMPKAPRRRAGGE